MRDEPFTVNYISVKNCYLYFSDHWIRRLSDATPFTVLKVDYKSAKRAYFSWNPAPLNTKDNSVVSLSATYARQLGIGNGDQVFISLHSHVATACKIHVSPLTSDDYEILEINQDLLQSSLLDQVQVIWPGQTLVAWVGKSVHVALCVDLLEPMYDVAKLQNLTQVVIRMCHEEKPLQTEVLSAASSGEKRSDDLEVHDSCSDLSESKSFRSIVFDSLRSISSAWWKDCGADSISLKKQTAGINVSQTSIYRIQPLPSVCNEDDMKRKLLTTQPYNVYIHRQNLPVIFCHTNNSCICSLTLIPFTPKLQDTVAISEKQNDAGLSTKLEEPNQRIINVSCKSLYVNVHVLEDMFNKLSGEMKLKCERDFLHGSERVIFITETIRTMLQVPVGSRVLLEPYTSDVATHALRLQVTPTGNLNIKLEDLRSMIKDFIAEQTKDSSLLINSNAILPIQQLQIRPYVIVKIIQPAADCVLLKSDSICFCKVDILQNNAKVLVDDCNDTKDSSAGSNGGKCFSYLEKEIIDGIISLEMTLDLQPGNIKVLSERSRVSVANMLIVGKSGSGVSTFARHLCAMMSGEPWYCHFVELHCRNLKGKKVEMLLKILSGHIEECAYYQPSILVLHNLEALAPTVAQDQEGADAAYFVRVGEMLSDILEDFQKDHKIAVIATTVSVSRLNRALMSARGRHIFQTVLQIPELSKVDRVNVLHKIIEEKVCIERENIDTDSLAHKTEGFVVQDLVDLVEKGVFEAWKRSSGLSLNHSLCRASSCFLSLSSSVQDLWSEASEDSLSEDLFMTSLHLGLFLSQKVSPPVLGMQDMESALRRMQPLSLHGVELVRGSDRSWEDVGGLQEAKAVLVEILDWPVQYPEVFRDAPLRTLSGMLLYGAPGTGKTLLARAVAAQCQLSFISIKGPELLSKYIGASEEGVRNIFQKAQSAKPCVLFFDEFDSLAPRRGHDSTGVTDRVVNQLLTQLDGVESLQGVWILAATSRPDLLDPALLRPGRLDRSLHCPLPSEEDRLSILTALSRRLRLAPDVDLAHVAKLSADFTGADLQAVLYTAQLAATETAQQRSETTDLETRPLEPALPAEVTQKQLLAALHDTRPSLSPQERLKYRHIYNKFERGQKSDQQKESVDTPIKQRVTLA